MTIEVLRGVPPALGRCKAPACGRVVEWVLTVNAKRMPVEHPLTVEHIRTRDDGSVVAVIDAGQSHFVHCVAAQQFSRRRR